MSYFACTFSFGTCEVLGHSSVLPIKYVINRNVVGCIDVYENIHCNLNKITVTWAKSARTINVTDTYYVLLQ